MGASATFGPADTGKAEMTVVASTRTQDRAIDAWNHLRQIRARYTESRPGIAWVMRPVIYGSGLFSS